MRLEPIAFDHPPNPIAGSLTLDEILANNAHRHDLAPGLCASQLRFVESWRDVDAAVSALAAEFSQWRLGEDAVVGVQLGSSPQAALACLALWRAGLVPAALPLAWRRREIVAALDSVGASAILTFARGGGAALGEIACEVAAGLDAIRFVGCFGEDPPDGATPLDEALSRPAERFVRPDRPDDAADHVAVVTFDAGRTPVARSHNELLAAGFMPLVASGLTSDSSLFSTLDLGGLAGLATGLVPWLASGCAATFHQVSTTQAFADAVAEAEATHLVAPGRPAAQLVADGAIDPAGLSALTLVWRAPDGRGADLDPALVPTLVDARFFGELGLHAAARDASRRPADPPLGTAGPANLPPLIELKVSRDGRVVLHGAVCPAAPCPAVPGAPHLVFDDAGFVHTGLAGVADAQAGRLSLGGKRRGVLQVGGLALSSADVEEAYRRSGVRAAPASRPDETFGARITLAPGADGGGATVAAAASLLEAAGFSLAVAPAEIPAVEEPEAVRRTA